MIYLYYINLIFFYSLLGFVLESVVYKVTNTNSHSSIFMGPYTLVYGFGMLFCLLIYNNLNLEPNFLTYLLYYLIFTFITTLTEYIGGNVIHYFLKIDKWNYTNHKYHFGKYICLDYAIYWGILSSLVIYFLHPFFNQNIILNIPSYATYIILLIFIIDLIILIKKKIIKSCK